MNLELEKIKLAQKIFNIDSEELIARIKAFISSEETDSWESMPDEIRLSIEKSIHQADSGEIITHENAIKQLKKWH
jgi:hypothetical protein